MSLLIGDDYPEAARSPDREEPTPSGDLRRRPGPEGKKRDWSHWRGNRRRSMLIQDPPDLAGDGPDDGHGPDDRYGPDDGYGAIGGYGTDNGYGSDYGYDAAPPDSRDGFFLGHGPGPDDYPRDGYAPHGSPPGGLSR